MNKTKWERLCTNCGLCCHEKVILDDLLIIDTDHACEFYDNDKERCSVYDHRFKACKRCMKVNLFRAMFATYLPLSCGYVRWAKEHHIRLVKDKECIVGGGTLDMVKDYE